MTLNIARAGHSERIRVCVVESQEKSPKPVHCIEKSKVVATSPTWSQIIKNQRCIGYTNIQDIKSIRITLKQHRSTFTPRWKPRITHEQRSGHAPGRPSEATSAHQPDLSPLFRGPIHPQLGILDVVCPTTWCRVSFLGYRY